MVELGRIERPEAKSFSGRKKLYYVPNIPPVKDAEEEYNNLVNKFWDDVETQLGRLETAGKVSKILCENLYDHGEDALKTLININERAHNLVKKKVDEGATIMPIEDKDILDTFVDWRNCLAIIRSREAFNKIYEFYNEAFERRLKHIKEAIERSLSEGEAGLLIIGDEIRVKLQLPREIELFLIMPPSYDDLMRWLRERLTKAKT